MTSVAEANGVRITREGSALRAECVGEPLPGPLYLEVDYKGNRFRKGWFNPTEPLIEALPKVDLDTCNIRVIDGTGALAELAAAEKKPYLWMPFMERQGEQHHVTESYISVPPALTITDERGDVWTLGFISASKWQAPDGEFAFEVLRNGIGTMEIASRIERRGGRTRIFTKDGWKNWSGREFV